MNQAIKDAMERICARAEELCRRDWMHKPQNMDGQTVATDGISLLVTDGHHGLPHPNEMPTKCIKDWLARKGDAQHCLELSALLDWIGGQPVCEKCKGKLSVVCPECKGAKTVRHECNCEHCFFDEDEDCAECGGDGSLRCSCLSAWQEEPFRLFGRKFDRRILRQCLPQVSGPVEIDMVSDPLEQVLFRHADWTLIAMPMRETKDDAALPSFPEAGASE